MELLSNIKDYPLKPASIKEFEDVEKQIRKLLDEFIKVEDISDEEKTRLIAAVNAGLRIRKMQLLIDSKLSTFSEKADWLLNCVPITKECNEQLYKKDLFYVKNTKHSITYE